MTTEPNMPGYFYDPADEAGQDDSDRRKKWLQGDSKGSRSRRRSDTADQQGEDPGAVVVPTRVATEGDVPAVASDLPAENDSPEPPDSSGSGLDDPESAIIRSVVSNADAAREAAAARQEEPSDSSWFEPSDEPGNEPEWSEDQSSPADGGGPNVPDGPCDTDFGRPDREDDDGSEEPDEPESSADDPNREDMATDGGRTDSSEIDQPPPSEPDSYAGAVADAAGDEASAPSGSTDALGAHSPTTDPLSSRESGIDAEAAPTDAPEVGEGSEIEGEGARERGEPVDLQGLGDETSDEGGVLSENDAPDQQGAEPTPVLQFDERQAPSLTRDDRGGMPPQPQEPEAAGDEPDFFYNPERHVPPIGSTAALLLASAGQPADDTDAETAAPVDDDPFAEFSDAIRALEADIVVEDGVDAGRQPAAGAAPVLPADEGSTEEHGFESEFSTPPPPPPRPGTRASLGACQRIRAVGAELSGTGAECGPGRFDFTRHFGGRAASGRRHAARLGARCRGAAGG